MSGYRASEVAEVVGTLIGTAAAVLGLEGALPEPVLLGLIVVFQAGVMGLWRRRAREWELLYQQEIRHRRPVAGVVIPPGDHGL